jgi:hypothetical protein
MVDIPPPSPVFKCIEKITPTENKPEKACECVVSMCLYNESPKADLPARSTENEFLSVDKKRDYVTYLEMSLFAAQFWIQTGFEPVMYVDESVTKDDIKKMVKEGITVHVLECLTNTRGVRSSMRFMALNDSCYNIRTILFSDTDNLPTPAYLDIIKKWHKSNYQVIRFSCLYYRRRTLNNEGSGSHYEPDPSLFKDVDRLKLEDDKEDGKDYLKHDSCHPWSYLAGMTGIKPGLNLSNILEIIPSLYKLYELSYDDYGRPVLPWCSSLDNAQTVSLVPMLGLDESLLNHMLRNIDRSLIQTVVVPSLCPVFRRLEPELQNKHIIYHEGLRNRVKWLYDESTAVPFVGFETHYLSPDDVTTKKDFLQFFNKYKQIVETETKTETETKYWIQHLIGLIKPEVTKGGNQHDGPTSKNAAWIAVASAVTILASLVPRA